MFIEGSLVAHHFFIGLCVLIITSFIAGYIDSIAGGAGLILIPAFTLAGFPPQLALGQAKLFNTIGTLAAINNFIKSQSIIWKIIPSGILSALMGAYAGARTILILPAEALSYIIVIMLPVGLVAAFLKGKITSDNRAKNSEKRTSLFIVFITCFIVGFYDGFFGPGTGSLFIIALTLINRLNLLQASATSKIFNLASNIGAFIAFLLAGQMAFIIGIPMIIASLVGNHIGSLQAIKTEGEQIRKVLIITVSIMVITLLFKAING